MREIEESLRRELFSLPEEQRKPALEAMQALLDELAAAEHGMDSFRFAFDWSRGEMPTCPCGPMAECPLLFTEIGHGEDQQPGDRATPEELARCPLQARRELVLWGVAPKEHFWEWWQRRKGEPARGRLFWMNAEGIGWPVDMVEGKTVVEMMRRARRMPHVWVARKGEQGETGEVFLMPTMLDKAGGSR